MDYRNLINCCKTVKRSEKGISKQFNCSEEKVQRFINRGINEGVLKKVKDCFYYDNSPPWAYRTN